MTEKPISCPLCTSKATLLDDHNMDRFKITCPKCKVFKITSYALAILSMSTATEREGLVVKFDVFEEVYGKETIPTICSNGNEFEVRHE